MEVISSGSVPDTCTKCNTVVAFTDSNDFSAYKVEKEVTFYWPCPICGFYNIRNNELSDEWQRQIQIRVKL
jgi:hypothetical protein